MAFNPANRLPPDFDDLQPGHYDPSFSQDINTKMHIPDRLAAFNGPDDELMRTMMPNENQSAPMTVPERILVAGQEQHIGMREDLKLNTEGMPGTGEAVMHVGLSTPPRTLTINERAFPDAEEKSHQNVQNGYLPVTPRNQRMHSDYELLATPGDGLLLQDSNVDEVTLLQRQIAKLTWHVNQLEEDNSRRNQRENIVYPIVVAYFVIKFALWFLRS